LPMPTRMAYFAHANVVMYEYEYLLVLGVHSVALRGRRQHFHHLHNVFVSITLGTT
jgi:hypothetical protein